MAGPLTGIRIIELAGIGPAPFAGMMLADHGAEVIRIDRIGATPPRACDVLERSRDTIRVDLKSPEGVALVRDLVGSADGLIEGFRPGVAERMGLGPDVLLGINPRLVYGRMTGWGQTGPYAPYAGHDINYIALSGALHGMGRKDENPVPPLNLVGDFGGGGMMLAFGMVSALLHARSTGEGQVIDAAMTDGSALLMGLIWALKAEGRWRDERGVNILDTGAFFYDSYRTRDGLFIALGSIEPQFYALLREKAGLDGDPDFDVQTDPSAWPRQREKLAAVIAQRSRDEWCAIMEHTDICFAPVLSMEEARVHPHNVARETFITVDGVPQPAPAPRYSRSDFTPVRSAADSAGSREVLLAQGIDPARVAALLDGGTVR